MGRSITFGGGFYGRAGDGVEFIFEVFDVGI